jgi:branched-chain amino acid transport system ATP-binding protein/urea transport system ATP-binding protein
MGDLALETRDLEKHFGGVTAVAGVNFRLREGELRCLIGPNGAGKSTFFKLLTGQLRATAGKVYFEGVDISTANLHEIARLGVGVKNQLQSVFDGLSVSENLWVAARSRHGPRRADGIAGGLLDRLHLSEVAEQKVGTLAHGQRQWVEIGMVLAQRPRLVLLDEPTAGMGADEVARTAELIRQINRDASVIVVEHDMQFIRQLAALVTVFYQGQILIEDTMDVIQHDRRVREIYLGRSYRA